MSLNKKNNVRPWDIFNKNIIKVEEVVFQERMDTCKACPEFLKLTSQCKECGCLMTSKAKMQDAECPLGKWKSFEIPLYEEMKGSI
jgi:hypothetical protein